MGVPQGSILGPLLFNTLFVILFFTLEKADLCNYADDTGLYSYHQDLPKILSTLEHDTSLAIEWFESNYIKLNKSKYHLLLSGLKYENLWIKVGW